ncbi:MAG: M48 family metallopeptidase [Thermodesulfobacteriota bacterium]|nr:M48 family metallopeptidase [Thermodesulfobacteriota bacterium]
MMKPRQLIVLFILVFTLVACATSPTGRRQLMLVSEEHAINASASAYVQTIAPLQKQGKIDNDPALKARVKRITGLLVAQAVIMRPETRDWKWSMKVIDDPKTVNAWCMAGGKMALYTGLVEQIKPTDDELAQVIGHEIAHALANHTAEKMSISMASTLGVLAVGIATDTPGVTAGAAAAAMMAVTLPNSRTAETEADRIGIELAAKAGFNPNAAVSLWEKMENVSGSSSFDFLSTHPSSGKRQQRLGELVPQMIPYYEDRGERPVYPL